MNNSNSINTLELQKELAFLHAIKNNTCEKIELTNPGLHLAEFNLMRLSECVFQHFPSDGSLMDLDKLKTISTILGAHATAYAKIKSPEIKIREVIIKEKKLESKLQNDDDSWPDDPIDPPCNPSSYPPYSSPPYEPTVPFFDDANSITTPGYDETPPPNTSNTTHENTPTSESTLQNTTYPNIASPNNTPLNSTTGNTQHPSTTLNKLPAAPPIDPFELYFTPDFRPTPAAFRVVREAFAKNPSLVPKKNAKGLTPETLRLIEQQLKLL